MPWERCKWAELRTEERGKGSRKDSAVTIRVSKETPAKRRCVEMVGKRNSTHGHPRAWVLSCDLQTEGCSDHQALLLTLTNMLKRTNPTTCAMCFPNWSCFPDMLCHFPLIGIHEPARICKHPETIAKTRDPPGMEATASWTRMVMGDINSLQIHLEGITNWTCDWIGCED